MTVTEQPPKKSAFLTDKELADIEERGIVPSHLSEAYNEHRKAQREVNDPLRPQLDARRKDMIKSSATEAGVVPSGVAEQVEREHSRLEQIAQITGEIPQIDPVEKPADS